VSAPDPLPSPDPQATAAVAPRRGVLRRLYDWVLHWADTPYATPALFLLAFAESSFFPIPPDVLLIALCLGERHKAFRFAFWCSVGSVLGGMAGYGIGYYGGRPLVKRLFSARRVAAVESYYDRYKAWAIGIAGLTPLPYKLFTLSAGAFAVELRTFFVASVLGRSLRFFAVSALLYVYGEPIRDFIERYFNVVSIAFVVLLVLGFWIVGRGLGRHGGGPEAGVVVPGAADE
jgi:membrane protein YqaA with SNARE-associated domain